MRNIFKSDERPGGNTRDPDDLHQLVLLRKHCRIHALPSCAMPCRHAEETYRDAYGKQQRHPDDQPQRQLLIFDADERGQQDKRHGQQDLTQIYIVSEDAVHRAKLEDPVQKIPGEQRQRGCVCPEHGCVRQYQEPRRQKAVVISESGFCIGIGSARIRVPTDQIVIVAADHQHQRRTDQNTDNTSQRSCLQKVRVAGHDKRAPSDTCSQR